MTARFVTAVVGEAATTKVLTERAGWYLNPRTARSERVRSVQDPWSSTTIRTRAGNAPNDVCREHGKRLGVLVQESWSASVVDPFPTFPRKPWNPWTRSFFDVMCELVRIKRWDRRRERAMEGRHPFRNRAFPLHRHHRARHSVARDQRRSHSNAQSDARDEDKDVSVSRSTFW